MLIKSVTRALKIKTIATIESELNFKSESVTFVIDEMKYENYNKQNYTMSSKLIIFICLTKLCLYQNLI